MGEWTARGGGGVYSFAACLSNLSIDGGGVYSFVGCLSHLTFDHASLGRLNGVVMLGEHTLFFYSESLPLRFEYPVRFSVKSSFLSEYIFFIYTQSSLLHLEYIVFR